MKSVDALEMVVAASDTASASRGDSAPSRNGDLAGIESAGTSMRLSLRSPRHTMQVFDIRCDQKSKTSYP